MIDKIFRKTVDQLGPTNYNFIIKLSKELQENAGMGFEPGLHLHETTTKKEIKKMLNFKK